MAHFLALIGWTAWRRRCGPAGRGIGLSLLLLQLFSIPFVREIHHHHQEHGQRNEKISNNSSFGIIDIAEHSSITDRIIVIVKTACLIHDGAYR